METISLSQALIAIAVVSVALALTAVGRGLIRELRLHREDLKGVEARLRGLEDALVALQVDLRSLARNETRLQVVESALSSIRMELNSQQRNSEQKNG